MSDKHTATMVREVCESHGYAFISKRQLARLKRERRLACIAANSSLRHAHGWAYCYKAENSARDAAIRERDDARRQLEDQKRQRTLSENAALYAQAEAKNWRANYDRERRAYLRRDDEYRQALEMLSANYQANRRVEFAKNSAAAYPDPQPTQTTNSTEAKP